MSGRNAPALLVTVLVGGTAAVLLWASGNAVAGSAARPWRVMTLRVHRARPFSFAEPGIAVGPDGLMMLDAASANTGSPPTFWLTRDGGRNWPLGRDFDLSGASTGDADVAIGTDGFLYALNLGYNPRPPGQPANPTVLVFRSRDGWRWRGPGSFPAPHGLDQPDRPWLVVDPRHPSHVDVLNSEGGGNIVIWRSTDHGARFVGPRPVTGGGNSQSALALSSRPLFDPTREGRMFMLYETAGGSSPPAARGSGQPPYEFPLTQLWLASSTDSGQTWSSRLVLDTATLGGRLHRATLGHLLVASAIDLAGRLYGAVSIRYGSSTRTDVYLIHSRDHGVSWSIPLRIHAPTRSNVMPALAVTGDGIAYLGWYGARSFDWRSSSATWAEMFAQVSRPLSSRPQIMVRQVSSHTPVHRGGIDTAGALASDLGANWGLRDFQSVGVDPCGQPRLVWADDYHTQATQIAFPAGRCRR